MDSSLILIIQNNTELLISVKQKLYAIGYTNDEIISSTSLEFAQELNHSRPDCIFTDLLPDDNDIIQKILHRFPRSGVIVLAYAYQVPSAIKAVEVGASDYLIEGEYDQKDLKKAIVCTMARSVTVTGFGELFDENPAPMYIYDDGTLKFLAVNQAALIQYGYSRQEFLLLTAEQLRPAEELDHFMDAFQGAIDAYYDFGVWKHQRKNGEQFFAQIHGHSIKFEGKQAKSILAINVDEKVKAEMTISEINYEISNVLNSITDGFLATNKNWELTYFNKAAERLLACEKEQAFGKNIWDFFPHSKEGSFYPQYLRAMTEKVTVNFEELYTPLNLWVSVTVYPTRDGIAAIFTDISEQKRIQEKIFNDKQNLRAIINNTKDIIWSLDKHHNIISANQAFWSRRELTAEKKSKRFTGEDINDDQFFRWQAYLQRAFEGESYKILWEDDTEEKVVFEEISFNPIRDKGNAVIGISCFSRDVTEQHQHLRMIERQNVKLREIARIQSHEVRGPLTTITAITNLFNHEDKADPLNSQLIWMIAESINQLDQIIRKINDQTEQIDKPQLYISPVEVYSSQMPLGNHIPGSNSG